MDSVWQTRLGHELPEAIESGELQLHYQPIVEIESGSTVQIEALLRWYHPEQGELPAAMFIAAIADLGMLPFLDRWVLRRGCDDLASWQATGGCASTLSVCINVAPEEVESANFVESTLAVIHASGLSPRRVILEVTEAGRLSEPEIASLNLHEIRESGVRIAIDDFGCEQSLFHFHRLPCDQLKLDKSLIRGFSKKGELRAVAEAAAAMAMAESVCLVAEGIESQPDLRAVRTLGCSLAQGFFIARPMAAPQLLDFLERERLQSTHPHHQKRRSRVRATDRWRKTGRSPAASARRSNQPQLPPTTGTPHTGRQRNSFE